VQPDIAEHMRHEIQRREDSCERRIADAQAARIGAERGQHCALAVTGKTAPFHGASTACHTRFGMQVARDLTKRAGGFVPEDDRTDCDFARNHALDIRGHRGIVITGNPDPVAARLECRHGAAIGARQPLMRRTIMKTVAKRDHHARIVPRHRGSEAGNCRRCVVRRQ